MLLICTPLHPTADISVLPVDIEHAFIRSYLSLEVSKLVMIVYLCIKHDIWRVICTPMSFLSHFHEMY